MALGVAFYETVKSGEQHTTMELVDTTTIDFVMEQTLWHRVQYSLYSLT